MINIVICFYVLEPAADQYSVLRLGMQQQAKHIVVGRATKLLVTQASDKHLWAPTEKRYITCKSNYIIIWKCLLPPLHRCLESTLS